MYLQMSRVPTSCIQLQPTTTKLCPAAALATHLCTQVAPPVVALSIDL